MSKQVIHNEWRKENTLTSPSDRDPSKNFRGDKDSPPLTNDQITEAMKQLNNTSYVQKFPEVERRYADPPIDGQKIGLFSFVPAKGATPNEKGVYGFAKLRGNFSSNDEASERAEFIIRTTDSYHQLHHVFVGRPYPLTVSSDFSEDIHQVDLRKEMTEAYGESVKKKREKEQQEIEEIKQRERNLLEDVKKTEEDLDDRYTTLQVKRAQLVWTYSETEKKMKQMCGLIARAKHEIADMEKKHPELRDGYYQKYMDARRQAGLPIDRVTMDESFMKYLVEDLKIPAVDEEYQQLFGK